MQTHTLTQKSTKMAQARINVEPFKGIDKESFRQFEQLFLGVIGVEQVPAAQLANFLQLHLRDGALRYFQTLPEATRQNLDLALTALRDQFCNVQLHKVHILALEHLRFYPKTDTPANFLTNVQLKAQRAYPTPEPAVVAAANPADDEAEIARVERVPECQDGYAPRC